MKKSILKFVALVVLVTMMITLLAACGNSNTAQNTNTNTASAEATKAAPVTLTLMANQDWVSKPYMKAAWKNYEDKTGNKLDIQAVPIDSGEQVMKTKFAAGEVPDIFMHFGGYSLTPFKPADNFVDFSNAPWVSDVQGYVLDQIKFDGKVYGIPHWEASISGMIYNKEIFTKLNISVPTTQEEFVAACEKVKASGITPIYMAFKDVWPLLYQFPMDTMVKDPAVLSKLNSNQLKYADITGFTDMLTWFKTMAEQDYLGKKFTTNTWDGAPAAMAGGTYAMMYVWDSWVDSDLEPKAPGASAKFGLMPCFMGTPSQGTYEGPNCCITFANKNSKNVQAATDFVNFLGTPENYNLAFKDYGTAPVFKGENTNKTTNLYSEAKASIDAVGNSSIAVNSIIGFDQVEPAKYIQELMLGGITVDEAVKAMDKDRMEAAKAQQVPGF